MFSKLLSIAVLRPAFFLLRPCAWLYIPCVNGLCSRCGCSSIVWNYWFWFSKAMLLKLRSIDVWPWSWPSVDPPAACSKLDWELCVGYRNLLPFWLLWFINLLANLLNSDLFGCLVILSVPNCFRFLLKWGTYVLKSFGCSCGSSCSLSNLLRAWAFRFLLLLSMMDCCWLAAFLIWDCIFGFTLPLIKAFWSCSCLSGLFWFSCFCFICRKLD